MVRNPALRPLREQFEGLSTSQIFHLFESPAKSRRGGLSPKDLAEAWGILFSGLFLSAGEVTKGVGETLGKERENVLHEFTREDAKSGGDFILEVVRNGGKIDRAALMMIADPEDLCRVAHHGSTAIHILASACDRGMRPALIGRVGKKGLSELFDDRGIPVLFTILGLKDLARDDLAAIGKIFTRDELRKVKAKNRTGRNGLELYSEATRRLTGREPDERNSFAAPGAVKNTNLRGQMGPQLRNRSGRDSHLAGTDVMGESRGGDHESDTGGSAQRYDDMMTNPLDNIRDIVHRKGTK